MVIPLKKLALLYQGDLKEPTTGGYTQNHRFKEDETCLK